MSDLIIQILKIKRPIQNIQWSKVLELEFNGDFKYEMKTEQLDFND